MKVEDIMTSEVISVQGDTSIIEVAKLLWKNKIHSLPVVDNKSQLVGIITEMDFFIKDVISSYFPRWLELMSRIRGEGIISSKEQQNLDYIIDLKVEDIMTTQVVTVKPETTVKELMDIFMQTHFKTFPVISKEKTLVGIVSLVDVIKSIEL